MKYKKIVDFTLKKPLLTLFLFGSAVRLLLFVIFYNEVSIFPDSEGYLDLANRLGNLDLKNYNGLRSPGYPLLITLLLENTYLVIFFQMLLGIFKTFFWYKTLLGLQFNKKFSLLLTLLTSLFINDLFYEHAILVESITVFLMSFSVYFIVNYFFKASTSSFKLIVFSFLLGYLVFIKSFFIFIPFLLLLFSSFTYIATKRLIFKRVLILFFPLMAFLGWSYVNYTNINQFTSSGISGLYLSQNCVYFAEKAPKEFKNISTVYVSYREKAILKNRDVSQSIWYAYDDCAFNSEYTSLPDLSNALGEFAKETIKKNPLDYLEQVLFRSWTDFWNTGIFWNYDSFNFKYANKLFLGLWYLNWIVIVLFKITFLLLFPFMVYKSYQTKKISIILYLSALVFSASVLQAVVTFGENYRFSFPFEYLMVFIVLTYFKDRNLLYKH